MKTKIELAIKADCVIIFILIIVRLLRDILTFPKWYVLAI